MGYPWRKRVLDHWWQNGKIFNMKWNAINEFINFLQMLSSFFWSYQSIEGNSRKTKSFFFEELDLITIQLAKKVGSSCSVEISFLVSNSQNSKMERIFSSLVRESLSFTNWSIHKYCQNATWICLLFNLPVKIGIF